MKFRLLPFTCDLRALALFRITLGLALPGHISSFADRLPSNAPIWVGVFAAILMCLGYRTRLMTALSWSVLLLIGGMAAKVPDEGTRLMMALLYLAIFLPLGAAYSVDSAVDPEPASSSERYRSVATVALTLQVAWFLVGAIFDLWLLAGPMSNTENSVSLHAATIGVIALVALLPSKPFDYLGRRALALHHNRIRIYYDRDCGFCRKTCLLFRTFLLLGETSIQPAQEDPEAFEIMQEHNTWVIFDHDDQRFIRWHAVLLLLRRSILLRPLGLVLTAAGMGRWCDWLYAAIAASRGWWSSVAAWLLPYRHVKLRPGDWANAVLILWAFLILWFNFGPELPTELTAAHWFRLVIDGFAINQRWHWLAGSTVAVPG